MVTPSHFDMLRDTLRHLREQELRERLELVLVAPRRDGFERIKPELDGFWGHKLVEVGDFETTGTALAAGYRAASAPVIGYVEEHSFPQPGWAKALIEAHRGPWAAVGVGVENANPQTKLSWASLLTSFGGGAIEPRESGEVDALPAHHVHYKRAAIEPHLDELEELLEQEPSLWDALRSRGGRLYQVAGARERHINVSALGSFVSTAYLGGRTYGAARLSHEGFSTLKRVLYSLATPLIVAVKLRRVLKDVDRMGRREELIPRVLPQILLGLTSAQLGELHGYVAGAGSAAKARLSRELDRSAHVASGPGEGRSG